MAYYIGCLETSCSSTIRVLTEDLTASNALLVLHPPTTYGNFTEDISESLEGRRLCHWDQPRFVELGHPLADGLDQVGLVGRSSRLQFQDRCSDQFQEVARSINALRLRAMMLFVNMVAILWLALDIGLLLRVATVGLGFHVGTVANFESGRVRVFLPDSDQEFYQLFIFFCQSFLKRLIR